MSQPSWPRTPPFVVLAVLLLLTVGLAGCFGDDGDDDGAATPPGGSQGGGAGNTGGNDGGGGSGSGSGSGTGPSPTTPTRPRPPPSFLVRGTNCTAVTAVLPVPVDTAQGYLPDGFTALDLGQAQGVGQDTGLAAARVVTRTCEVGGVVGRDAELDGWGWHHIAIMIETPEPFTADGELRDAFAVGVTAADDVLATAFTQRNWTVPAGTAEITRPETPDPGPLPVPVAVGGGPYAAEASGGELATTVAGTAAPAGMVAFPSFTRVWTVTADGRVEYHHEAIVSAYPAFNATATVTSSSPTSLTASALGPANEGTAILAGNHAYLATPVFVRYVGDPASTG